MFRRAYTIRWIITLSIVTALTVSARAAVNGPWAHSDALGDVIVSFGDGAVRVYSNADGLEKTPPNISVAGTNRGIAFDGSLTLFVTNTNGTTHSVVKLSPDGSHTSTTTPTQANSASIVFAGDGTYYVASRVSSTQALIRRFATVGTTVSTTDFNVTVSSSGTCIGIDLDANQKTLYIVDGATNPQPRWIWTLDVSLPPPGPPGTLPHLATALTGNQGSACGIRALPPERHSWTSLTSGPTNGGFLVADKDRIQRLTSTGAPVAEYTTGTSSRSDNNWLDVDLDPNTFDFWGLDAGELRAAKFRISAAPDALLSISNLPGVPRGLTLNGALRAAQTIRLLNIAANTATTVKFLQDAPLSYQHEFQIKLPEAASLSVQAVEARSDGDPAGEQPTTSGDVDGICPASLDIDCRIDEFFAATADDYSRNRAVFYMVTELSTLTSLAPIQIAVVFTGSNPGSGGACVPDPLPPAPPSPRQSAFALLRDPFPHTNSSIASGNSVFPEDITVLVYSDEVGTTGKTRVNHYVVVNRADTLYNANMVKPAPISTQQLGSTLQVAVEIRDPATNCSVVPGLVGTLALSVTNLTTKKLVADSEEFIGSNVMISGLEFVSTAGQYRTNITLSSPTFEAGNDYRVCVNAKTNAGFLTDPNDRAIGEVCQQFTAVAGKGKTK